MNDLARASLCAFSLTFFTGGGQPAARAQGPQPSPPAPKDAKAPKKEKKIPPGARGFERYATRDASDKLVVGAATRCLEPHCPSYAQGMKDYEAGRYREARDNFRESVKLKGDWDESRYWLAAALARTGEHEEAAAEFNHAARLATDAASRGIAGKTEAEKNELTRLFAHYGAGNSFAELGEYELAAEAFRDAVKVKPGLSRPHYNLGLSYRALDRKGEALAAFAEAVRLNPAFAEARYNLGVLAVETGDRRAAEAQSSALSKLKPELAEKLNELLRAK